MCIVYNDDCAVQVIVSKRTSPCLCYVTFVMSGVIYPKPAPNLENFQSIREKKRKSINGARIELGSTDP